MRRLPAGAPPRGPRRSNEPAHPEVCSADRDPGRHAARGRPEGTGGARGDPRARAHETPLLLALRHLMKARAPPRRQPAERRRRTALSVFPHTRLQPCAHATCTHACKHTEAHMPTHTYTCSHTHTYTCSHAHAHMLTSTRSHTRSCSHADTRSHAHTHALSQFHQQI